MKNFSVQVNNKEYWISRSIATCTFILRPNKELNSLFVLVEKRGKGAADENGKLCAVCGYLDYGETVEQCAARETKEETGFKIDPKRLMYDHINSDPSENHQNVTIHYTYLARPNEDFNLNNAVGGEKDEVADVFWLNVAKLENESDDYYKIVIDRKKIDDKAWAFEHDKCLTKLLRKIKRIKIKRGRS